MKLTQQALRAALAYDPETGVFRWKSPESPRVKPGQVAGSLSDKGYRLIKVAGRRYRAHRLAWLYMVGSWPEGDVDHRNGDRDDNRFFNLRDVTNQVNCMNRNKARGASGLVGVSQRGSRWTAEVYRDGRRHYCKEFATPDAARAAYLTAKAAIHPEVSWGA